MAGPSRGVFRMGLFHHVMISYIKPNTGVNFEAKWNMKDYKTNQFSQCSNALLPIQMKGVLQCTHRFSSWDMI